MPEKTPGPGHNQGITAAELRGFVERIERLIEERAAVNEQIRDVKTEADLRGYDKKALTEMIRLRAMDPEVMREREALRELYGEVLGVFR